MHVKQLVFSTHRNATQKHFIQNIACSQNLEFPFRDRRAGASKKTVKKVAIFDIVPSQACSAGCD